MKMVPNPKEVLRHYSTAALGFVAGVQGIWALMPQKFIDAYPAWVTPAVAYATGALAVLGLVGKFVKQDLPSDSVTPTGAT